MKSAGHIKMSLFDSKDNMIRTLCLWDQKTYSEALSEIIVTEENAASIELLKIVLKHQGLENKHMDGFSSQNLKKDEFERMGVCYVDFFNRLEERGTFWTPLDILHEVCKNNLERKSFYENKAKRYGMSFERVTWLMCGRALRALPSYIREYQLKNALQSAFPKGSFIQDSDLDMRFHCDLKMVLNDREYYFWSFISSTRSIYQFVDKFKDNRYGVVLDGDHVLCPFDRMKESSASYKGWLFYSPEYINEVKTAIYQREYLNYNDVTNGAIYDLKFYSRPVVISKMSTPVQAVC